MQTTKETRTLAAIAAMQGLCSSGWCDPEMVSSSAVSIADALIKELGE